jgi:hypothetical protein
VGKRGPKIEDITGREFGWVTALYPANEADAGGTLWVCQCRCGVAMKVRQSNLKQGKTASCGCSRSSKVIQTLMGRLFTSYKYSANRRGYDWELSIDKFQLLIREPCHYCGRSNVNCLVHTSSDYKLRYNGIDRKDNTGGYREDNAVTCCSRCNKAKGTSSYEEFIGYLSAIVEFQGKTKLSTPYCSGVVETQVVTTIN